MRCDQYIGLNARGHALVRGTDMPCTTVQITIYDDGRVATGPPVRTTVSDVTVEPYAAIDGAYDDVVADLRRHVLPDDAVLEEYVQEVLWSSWPMYFVALRDADGQPVEASLWTDDEMDEG